MTRSYRKRTARFHGAAPPARSWLPFLAGLFAASSLAAFDLVPNTGFQGQTLLGVRCITRPLPASGASVSFSPAGLTASNLRNDASGFLLFDLAISPSAPLGPYAGFYSHPVAGAASNPAAFTVLGSPTPSPTPPFGPTPTPTPRPTTPPGTTPSPTPTPPGPQPTPQPGSLRIAPDQVTEGAQRVRLVLAGSGFGPATTVQTPPDVRLDSLALLSATRLELFVSTAIGTPSGPRVFVVGTPGAPSAERPKDSSGTVVVSVVPVSSLAAPLAVLTAAIVAPRSGAFVAEGERVFARGLLAATGTGVILGSWQLDGVPFDRFEAYTSAGAPVEVASQVPIPLDAVGDHTLSLVVDHPQALESRPVLVVRVARRAAQFRAVEPDDGAVLSGVPRFRWTLVPGAQSYEVLIGPESDEASAARFRVAEADWTPSARQWRALGAGLRFWAVRPIFPVDVRGVRTAWRRLAAAPAQVRLQILPPRRDPESGCAVVSWRGGAVGLVYRVSFSRSMEEPPFFRGLSAQASYRVREDVEESAGGPLLYRVEALVPGGAAVGSSAVERLELPPGLARARQSSGRVPTAAEIAALERQLLQEDEDAGTSYDWKVDVAGMVVFRSGGPPAGTDTAHATLSSAGNFTGRQWRLAETVELAAHDQLRPQHFVQDSRNWAVRGGAGGDAVRADAMVGYAPPAALDGMQLLSGGLTRGGAEARLTTPVGAFSGYTSWDDRFLGRVSSVTAPEQRLRLGAYDLPLPADRFLVRGAYLDFTDGPTGPGAGATVQLWGGLGRFTPSPAFCVTIEGAHSKLTPGGGGPATRGNAFRASLQGTAGATSYAVNVYDTKATFSSPASRGFTVAGQPDRIGGDALVLQRFGRFLASAFYRFLETDADGAHGKSHSAGLTLNAPLAGTIQASASGLWSLDRGDASAGALGPLPRTDRQSYGGRLGLTEILGRLTLVESASWTRIRDDASSVNSATTMSASLLANGAVAPWFLLSVSAIATRNRLALSGDNDSVIAFVQPRLVISSLRLTFAPRAAYSYLASGASPVISRGEQYQALLSWAPALSPVQPILGLAGDWSRNRFGPGSPTAYAGRFTATLTLRWGGSAGERAAPRAADLELAPETDATLFTAALSGLASLAPMRLTGRAGS